jgi:uncharacterized membrane protein YczE
MTLMLLFKIYLVGLMILVVAIGLNILANLLGLSTWYSFLNQVSQQGLFIALKNMKATDFFFLILLYPFLLGATAYLMLNLSSHFLG